MDKAISISNISGEDNNKNEAINILDANNFLILFHEALTHDNIYVQIDAIRKLPTIAMALGMERTRHELLPYMRNYLEEMHEELLLNLAEQLEKIIPLIGGVQYADVLVDMLTEMSNIEEPIIHKKAVEVLKKVCSQMTMTQCEQWLMPFMKNLSDKDWCYTSKLTATSLIPTCYLNVSDKNQSKLREWFYSLLLHDDSPTVRRASGINCLEFLNVLQEKFVIHEFLPVFGSFTTDIVDNVRVIGVEIGIGIGKKITTNPDLYEFLKDIFIKLAEDSSWRVRQRIALKIHECLHFHQQNIEKMVNSIYERRIRDPEVEVRLSASKNLIIYCENVKQFCNNSPDIGFKEIFENKILPKIRHLITDPSDKVRLAISASILTLSTILDVDCFNTNIMPLLINVLENEESMEFKENILKNINQLPDSIDLIKSIQSISIILDNIIRKSNLHWRTRRNIVLVLLHIVKKRCTSMYFDQNLKRFYVRLLNDPIFAIRRASTVILPILIKHFGTNWANQSIIPIIASFAGNSRYLYRQIPLYIINELIFPTLDNDTNTIISENSDDDKYLGSLKKILSNNEDISGYVKILVKITQLNNKLTNELKTFDSIVRCPHRNDDELMITNNNTDNIFLYCEDLLEQLKSCQTGNIFALIDSNQIDDDNNNDCCYLEAVLFIINKIFVNIFERLMNDPIQNVRIKSLNTLTNITIFSQIITREIEQSWATALVQSISAEELNAMKKQLDLDLSEVIIPVLDLGEEYIHTDLMSDSLEDDITKLSITVLSDKSL